LKRQIAQRLQAESGLHQAGKLAVLGQMSAGISHEISQPLTALRALSGNTLRLLENGRQQAVADNLRAIDDVAERMTLITRQLKSFARKADSAVAPVQLAQAIRNVLLLLQHRIRAGQIEVRVDVPDELQVQCDGNRLEQVLVNLVGNALDAMDGAPRRVLSFACQRHGARALVRVSDTGPGMEEALLPRLFEPFFTTKPAGQGLGLGLVISSKIIHEFGGSLRGHSSADPRHTGMTFEFDLGAAAMKEQHV
jgi:two-component system C4-dicarboxylate transport sensor histidine kinase DctB